MLLAFYIGAIMIETFRGDYSFLSNFAMLEQPLHGYITVEHYYIACKTKDIKIKETIKNLPLKGLKAYGRTLELRGDWEDIKLVVMEYAVRYKFSDKNPILRSKLIATGNLHIQEGNYWNDKFWGVCLKTGVGENNLGKILMKIRGEIV